MNFFRPEHSHSKGRISVKFIRLDSHIEVRYRFCGIKKEYCSPEDVCEGLFIKADSEIQHLIEKWRDNHNKLQECKNKQILASQNIANRQMGSKRGSYKTSYNLNQDEFTKPQDRHYFCSQHRDYAGLILSNVFSAKRGEKWSGQYMLLGSRKGYRIPRSAIAWMDGKHKEFVDKELKRWMKHINNESGAIGTLYPDFFIQHRSKWLKYALQTAQSITVEGYYRELGNHIFPFFIGRLQLHDPNKWAEHYHAFDEFLEKRRSTFSSRNGVRNALSIYMRFLFKIGKVKVLTIPPRERWKRSTKEGRVIPGELPTWDDVAKWLWKLPPCRKRWIVAHMAMFGLRISEAMASDPSFLLGADDVEHEKNRNQIVAMAMRNCPNVVAFYMVKKAIKKQLGSSPIKNLLPSPNNKPKSGEYTVPCTSHSMGKLLNHMVRHEEYLPIEGEEEITMDQVRHWQRSFISKDTKFPFHDYMPHDFRRLAITLMCFDFTSLRSVSEIYHEDESTTSMYYQWALTERKKGSANKFKLIGE